MKREPPKTITWPQDKVSQQVLINYKDGLRSMIPPTPPYTLFEIGLAIQFLFLTQLIEETLMLNTETFLESLAGPLPELHDFLQHHPAVLAEALIDLKTKCSKKYPTV